MATRSRLLEGETVAIRSGVLPVHVGNPEGYELRGRKARVVRDEEVRPGVDELGKPSGKTESYTIVRPVLEGGRLGSPVDIPTRRLATGRTFGFFRPASHSAAEDSLIRKAFDALNPFRKREEPVHDELREGLVDEEVAEGHDADAQPDEGEGLVPAGAPDEDETQ